MTRRSYAVLLAAGIFHTMAALAADSATDVIARMDAYRMPHRDVQVDVLVQELDVALPAVKEEQAYRVYLNASNDSVVEMQNPDVRGRRVLMTDDAVWLYIPTSNRPIRITPLQRLLGQANYGDVGRMAWHGAYKVQRIVQESPLRRPPLAVAENLTRARFRDPSRLSLQQLTLEAVSATATYPRIDVWIDRASAVPVRADYFLLSGKLLKTAWFADPENSAEGPLIRAVAFVDPKSDATITVMTTKSVAAKRMPGSFFTVRGFTARAH